jgi:thiosulfate/3-mercaptopyruvate sulfurtransferase
MADMMVAGGEGSVSPLIGVGELADLLAGTSAPVVLDVRWTLAGSDRPAYLAEHIPTGVFVDLDAELAGRPGSGGRHPLPDPDALQRFWRSCGIDAGSTVVAYDDVDASAAARAWWLLRWSGIQRARVLDGGLSAWRAAGCPLVPGAETATAEGDVVVRSGGMPTVNADDLLGDLAERVVLLDARASRRYRGEVEPIDPVAGHIPGAVNLPYLNLLDDQRRFRPATELAAAFAGAGIGPGTVAAASCGSGVTACVLILAAACVDVDLALYPGSYSQWCALGRSVATGG